MKKFLLFFLVLLASSLHAQTTKSYTAPLKFTLGNGEESLVMYDSLATFELLRNDDGTVQLVLRNFVARPEGGAMAVGTIEMHKVALSGTANPQSFDTTADVTIVAGDEGTKNPLTGIAIPTTGWVGAAMMKSQGGKAEGTLRGSFDDENLQLRATFSMPLGDVTLTFGKELPTQNQQHYTDHLTFKLNLASGGTTTMYDSLATMTIVKNNNETVDLQLRNFIARPNGGTLNVGTILIKNVPVSREGNSYRIAATAPLTIEAGDAGVKNPVTGAEIGTGEWNGPVMIRVNGGSSVATLQGTFDDSRLQLNFDFNMPLGLVSVSFGQSTVTGVHRAVESDATSDQIFDLSGKRLHREPARGIYIKNGKRVCR